MSKRSELDQHVRGTILEDVNTVILQRRTGCSVKPDRLNLLVDRELPVCATSRSASDIKICSNALYTRRIWDVRCFATAHRNMKHSAVDQHLWGWDTRRRWAVGRFYASRIDRGLPTSSSPASGSKPKSELMKKDDCALVGFTSKRLLDRHTTVR